jgi:hypothetical protein
VRRRASLTNKLRFPASPLGQYADRVEEAAPLRDSLLFSIASLTNELTAAHIRARQSTPPSQEVEESVHDALLCPTAAAAAIAFRGAHDAASERVGGTHLTSRCHLDISMGRLMGGGGAVDGGVRRATKIVAFKWEGADAHRRSRSCASSLSCARGWATLRARTKTTASLKGFLRSC